MSDNFQDNIVYGNSTLAVSGDAIIVGSTDNGAKSVIFNNSGSQGHLAWQPTGNETIFLPNSGGTIQLTGQVPGAVYDGANSISSGTIRFTNANGVSFSINGQTISGSVAAQTNQTVGIYGVSNTTQSSSGTIDARSLSFQGAGIASVGYTNGSVVISVPSGGGAGDGVNIIAAGTQTANTTGTILFSNSNGISFGMSNSSIVTASFNGTLNSVVFSNANNITFGSAGNTTITASYSQSNQDISLFGLGNTTQNSSTHLGANAISLNGLGNITVGYSNGSIQISGAGGAASVNFSAGTTSNNLGSITFSNSNGVSFGLNGSTITGSVAAQTAQTVGLYALGNTTQNSSTTLDARTLSFNGLGIVTAGYSNGSIQISATQSVQSVGLYAVSNTTGASSSSTVDARSISFQGAGIASVGYTNGSVVISVPSGGGAGDGVNIIAAGTQTAATTGTVMFSNSNGVTFGMSNSSIVTASVAAQTNQTEGLYAIGNTVGQSSNSTFDARTLSISGAGIASVGYSGNALVISVPSAGASVNVSAGTTSGNLGAVVFSNSNGVSFGLNGSTITASAAGGGGSVNISAGTTSNNLTNFVFSNSNSVSFGLNGSTITANVPQATSIVAAGGIILSTAGSTLSISASNFGTLRAYEINPYMATLSTFFSGNSTTSGSASFFPFNLPVYVAAGHINIIQSMTLTTTSASGQQTYQQYWAVYTRGTGTNSTTIGTITSNSFSIGISQSNSSFTINQPTTSNATGYGTGSTTSGGTSITSQYTGLKLIQLQINSTMSPGDYWLGLFNAKSTSSANCGFGVSYYANNRASGLNNLAPIGSLSTVFSGGAVSGNNGALGAWFEGLGLYGSAGMSNLPVSLALSQISNSASATATVYPYLRIVGII